MRSPACGPRTGSSTLKKANVKKAAALDEAAEDKAAALEAAAREKAVALEAAAEEKAAELEGRRRRRIRRLIRRRPGSKGEVRSPNSNTRPPGPFHYDLYACGCCCPRVSYHRPMLTLHPNHFTGPTSLAQNALTCVCSTACCAQFY